MIKPKSPFRKGEVAVLVHDLGGRLFIVDSCRLHTSAHDTDKHWRIKERNSGPHGLEHEVSVRQLTKVRNRDDGIALVAVLNMMHNRYQSQLQDLIQEKAKLFKQAVAQYEVWVPDPEEDP